MELVYLQEKDIETPQYISFYEKYHGVGSFKSRRERIHWYFHSEGYRQLVAVLDGKYVGQSCAYKTTAIVNGQPCEWWWGVDGFVLEDMRGKGVGKALQRKLHEDCPNFSSASYSAVNGFIKGKLGDHEIMSYHQYYCPTSCFVSLYVELVLKKFLSRSVRFPRIRLPYFYSLIAGLKGKTDYKVHELTKEVFNDQLSGFIEDNLRNTGFHIQRTTDYIKWKYLKNPSIKYGALDVMKDGRRVGVIFYTNAYNGEFVVSKARVCKILDSVIKADSTLSQKELIVILMNHFKSKGVKLDGVLTLIPSTYWPQIKYPMPGSIRMLSTMDIDKIEDGYLAYSDQDMEQMYER